MTDSIATKFPYMTTSAALEDMPFLEPEWIVEDIVQANERRMSLLCGQPDAGKSTLAIQLAAAVAMGEDFLGKRTTQCEVLYWQTEAANRSLKNSLHRLGHRSSKHAMIHTFQGMPCDNTVKNMRDFLMAFPNVRLVIIETINGLLAFKDINDNSFVKEGFDRFDNVMGDLFPRIGILGLAQLKKTDTDKSGNMVLGATEIKARTGIKIYLRTKSDADDRRILHTTIREDGTPMKEVYVEHDLETGRSSLGQTLAEVRKTAPAFTETRIDGELKQYMLTHENAREADIINSVVGNKRLIGHRLKRLVRDGFAGYTGDGKKTSPRIYNPVRIPLEVQSVVIEDLAGVSV